MAGISIEQQLISKIRELDDDQKQRVLEFVDNELSAPGMSLGDWLEATEAFREELRQKYGEGHFHIQETLDEIREEASWPRS